MFSGAGLNKGGLFGTSNPAATASAPGLGLQLSGQQKPTATSTPVLSGILGGATTNSVPTASVLPSFSSTTAANQPNVGSLFGMSSGVAATSAATQAGTQSNFSFGIPKTSATSATGLSLNVLASTSTAPTSTGVSSLFSTTGVSATGLNLGLKSSAASSATSVSIQPTVTTSILGGSAAAQQTSGKEVTFKQLEENVSKWNDDLDDLERQFLAQATQINAWDRLVLENGDRITALNEEMGKIKVNQDKLDQDLDFIGTQQKDLEEFINNLEGSLTNSALSQPQDAADEQRRDVFATAESIDSQLKQMTQDLREVIERINVSSQNDESSVASPFGQLERILNAHVDSLNWADQNIENLGKQIDQIQIPKVTN